MQERTKYKPNYTNSWALVVGINNYMCAPPLTYACNDAAVFAEQLIETFDFPSANVTTLLNEKATLKNIQAAMHSLIHTTGDDDRVVVFYAGHGYTIPAHGKDAGFLFPVDGDSSDTSTLLPWDDLASTSRIIRAKHVLFIMDACYGGLIGMRALSPGSARFVDDMMSRYSRQFLTAGKADEAVADSGGPRSGHSVFTGHLLDALDGVMPTEDGIISANALMAHVYDRVARDPHSQQAPHYGFLAGDGDFFFSVPEIAVDPDQPKDAEDVLVEIPVGLVTPEDVDMAQPLHRQIEEYLSDHKHRISLHNLVKSELRIVQRRLSDANFSVQSGSISGDDFAIRLNNYEEAVSDFLQVPILLGRWADHDQQKAIQQIVHVLAGEIESTGGLVLWLALRSYPMLLAMYSGGIAAIDGDNYESLKSLFATRVRNHRRDEPATVLQATVEAMLDVNRTEAFKHIPEFKNRYAPQSDYLFKRIQPIVEDTLALGVRYEDYFDRFEMLYALNYVDHSESSWGPPGRFAWKYCGPFGSNPFTDMLEEARQEGDAWPPLAAGMFYGSHQRFLEVASRFEEGLLKKLNWH